MHVLVCLLGSKLTVGVKTTNRCKQKRHFQGSIYLTVNGPLPVCPAVVFSCKAHSALALRSIVLQQVIILRVPNDEQIFYEAYNHTPSAHI